MKRLLAIPVAALFAASVGLTTVTAPSSASTPQTAVAERARARTCQGHRATIVDEPGRHVIKGTRHRDVIWAGGGRDVVFGGKGRDVICGGKGADILNGMQGRRERISGGRGQDMCIAPQREHRFHTKCDVHSLPKPPPPPTPTVAQAARAVTRTATPARDVVQAQAAGFSAHVGTIHCDAGSQGPFYRPINVTATGGVSGLVSVVPWRHTWGTGGPGEDPWGPGTADPMQTFTVPTDGSEYTLPMTRYYLPTALDTHYIGYYFLWWNEAGTGYDDWAFGWVDYYSGGYFPTQNNGVCQPIGAGLIG